MEQESNPELYHQRLLDAGLRAYADQLLGLARRSIRLIPDPVDAAVPNGVTKLGGQPDLPPDRAWPHFRGLPLSFVAQVDLAEMEPHDMDRCLPADGLLSFFYDSSEMGVWGFDPADRGGWAVLYSPPSEGLRRREPPSGLPDDRRFGGLRLRARTEWTYPPFESVDVEHLDMARAEWLRYGEILEVTDGPEHRLLGHPDPIQGDMQLECQLVSHGLYGGDSSGYDDPRATPLSAGAADWRLLFQVDSQDEIDMMWGDAGRLYFWMHVDAFAKRDWDKAWLILQCG